MALVLARGAAFFVSWLWCAGCVFAPPAATEGPDSGSGEDFDAKTERDAAEDAEARDANPIDGAPKEMDAEPTDADSLDAEPVDAEPMDAEPMDAVPMDAVPMDAEPMDAEPIDMGFPDTGVFNGFPYLPRNFDPLALTPGMPVTLDCAARISALATLTIPEWCGQPLPVITAGPNGSFILAMESLIVGIDGSITIEGHRPVIFAVFGDATLNGPINSDGSVNFSGNGSSCPPSGTGGEGISDSSGAGGGGGAALGAIGGMGGAGSGGMGGSMGMIPASLSLVPPRGGCHGGMGGRDSGTNGGVAGFGGGGIQISAAGVLFCDSVVSANGSGGSGGNMGSGGGGGGSGGGILMESFTVDLTNFCWVTANGGGGGEGGAGGTGDEGDDGMIASSMRAPGGTGAGSGGDGGRGGAGAVLEGEMGFPGTAASGGGGGGGSVGVIIVDAMGGQCMNMSSSFSPAPFGNCP
jgi:hypothetical protein